MRKVTTLLSTLALATTLAAQTLPQTERQYLSGHGCDDMVEWDFYCTGGNPANGRRSVYRHAGSCRALAPISMESPFMAKHSLKVSPMKKECISTSLRSPRSSADSR